MSDRTNSFQELLAVLPHCRTKTGTLSLYVIMSLVPLTLPGEEHTQVVPGFAIVKS